MRFKSITLILHVCLYAFYCLPLSAQNVVLSGRVTDAQTGDPLVGVTVYNTDRRTGTATNSQGNYTITLPSGRQLELVFSYVGYASETQTLTLARDTKLDIQLRQDTQNLREVQVFGTRHDFGVQSSQMSAVAVSAEQIKKMPVLLGETDVLKSLQRLPGVQSAGDGKAGIYVRGGEQDQNLFTLDGITLYNPEHLQGFTSAINADLLDDVVLYKGAFPSRFGSRLSSVVDVSLREGDMERHRLSVTAGMLASRIQAEGPLWKGRTSYNVAARVSYFKAIVKPMLEEVIYDNPGQMNDYAHMRYWDVNAKLTHRFSENAKLSAVFYMGHDVNNATPLETSQNYQYDKWMINENGEIYSAKQGYIDKNSLSQTLNSWNNLLGGLNYTHRFSHSLKLDMGVSYSGYDYKLDYTTDSNVWLGIDIWNHGHDGAELYSQTDTQEGTSYHSKVKDMSARADLTYTWEDKHEVHTGIQADFQRISPEVYIYHNTYEKVALADSIVWNVGLKDDRYKTIENHRGNLLADEQTVRSYAAYAEDDWSIATWLKANLGIRLQAYETGGKTQLSVEPRASVRLSLAKRGALKASYARMTQGMHLLSNGNLVSPSEIWVPIMGEMKYGISDQVSAGLSYDLKGGIQLSAEGYYKWLDNVVDYKEGNTFMTANDWEEVIAVGEGKAYGIEFLAQKSVGSTTGMIGYTWSKSLRTFDREGMVLNGGREFYASGDRRNNFNISITQRLSKNWDFSAAWTYQSGRRASIAGTTLVGGILDEFNNYLAPPADDHSFVDYSMNPAYEEFATEYYNNAHIDHLVRMNTYSQRNSYQLPAVHHLDVSLSHHGSIGIGEMICDISIYNLYNQQNVSTVYWGFENNRRALKGVCMFPIMPSISLTLKL